jgi:hypothetical protein
LRSTAVRYLLALLVAVVAITLRIFLTPVLGGDLYIYLTLWPAVVFSAWYCGLGPSIVTVLSGELGVWYLLTPPFCSFAVSSPHIYGMLGFLFFAGLIVALGEANRRAQTALRRAHAELEQRVKERTAELQHSNDTLSVLVGRFVKAQAEERLLYQPSIKELGFEMAARWYVEELAAENGIKIELDIADGLGRLGNDIEEALFRVLQASLTDACRNSECATAAVCLRHSSDRVVLEVKHNGKSASDKDGQTSLFGLSEIALQEMRDTLTNLGGHMNIMADGDGAGTLVEAEIPIVLPPGTGNTRALSKTA